MRQFCFEEKHMDTRVNITVYSDNEDVVLKETRAAFAIFQKLEKQFSLFRSNSEISVVNTQAGQPTLIDQLFSETVQYALHLAEQTNGAFNPLIGSLTGPQKNNQPHNFNFRDITFNPAASTICIPKNSSLDLNSLVKGLALDMALQCFTNTENVMIEAGGDLVAKGHPAQTSSWTIGIRNPTSPEKIVTVLSIQEGAICTTGNYFRKQAAEQNSRAHLINPINNSTENQISSITVIAPSAKQADALSTAGFFLPINETINLTEKNGACCLLIDHQNEIYMSPTMLNTYFPKPTYENAQR